MFSCPFPSFQFPVSSFYFLFSIFQFPFSIFHFRSWLPANRFTGGAYVPTLFVGVYAPVGWLFLADSADMPKDGTSALPVRGRSSLSRQAEAVKKTPSRSTERPPKRGVMPSLSLLPPIKHSETRPAFFGDIDKRRR